MKISMTLASFFLFIVLFGSGTIVAIGQTAKARKPASQTARVNITQMGYEPATLRLKRGVPARITFVRMTDDTCATEVAFPSHGISRNLPLNQAVTISLNKMQAGEFNFTCGMGMHRGKLIVQ